MKRLFNSFIPVFLLAGIFLSGCEEQLTIFEGPYHVRFSGTSASVSEDATTVTTVQVHFAGPSPAEDIQVEFSVTGGVAGTDFEFVGSSGTTVTIPAGEFFATFSVRPVDNLVADGNKTIVFEITSVSGGLSAGLGLVGKKFTYTIVDNDCPFEVANFTGTYDCDEPGYGVYEVTLEAGAEPNTVLINNFWDAGATIYVVFDPDSNTLEVPDQPTGLDFGGPLHVMGSGTYAACDGNFSYNYVVYRPSDGTVFDDNTHTYTKR
ncbi:MAG: hypothetical protein KatS3mg032_1210 [Cyclobacteriaceae bacterium]|nr:MAG: hypothetical protein KatS3mg032_1210 [Cyclobacteriaceae bacterium]